MQATAVDMNLSRLIAVGTAHGAQRSLLAADVH